MASTKRRGASRRKPRATARRKSAARRTGAKTRASRAAKPHRAEISGVARGVDVNGAINDALAKLPPLGRKHATLAGLHVEDPGDGGTRTTHALLYVYLP